MTKLVLLTALTASMITSASADMGFGGMMKDIMDVPKEMITSTTDSMKDMKDSTKDSMTEMKDSATDIKDDVKMPTLDLNKKDKDTKTTTISKDVNESNSSK
jgi:outer membrane lipopolysaccharide assembly protein LptE/RlpB